MVTLECQQGKILKQIKLASTDLQMRGVTAGATTSHLSRAGTRRFWENEWFA